MSADEDLITVIPRDQPKDIVIVTIKEIFIAFLSSSKLKIHALDVAAILQNDCNISLANRGYDIAAYENIINLLTEGFFYYCKIWPGWRQKMQYLTGEVQFVIWHKHFKEYVSYKCAALLESTKSYVKALKSTGRSTETQTEETSTESFNCPYKLVIGGHPMIVNNIAILTRDNNIYIKQHPIKPWTALTVAEFINWPYIAVELKLLNLHIERVNVHNFSRYITIDHSELNFENTDLITHIKKHSSKAVPYTYSFLKFYVKQLFEVLRSIKQICKDHLKNLEMICEQFLEDIKEMDINGGSMQTHTTVGFHIGRFKYFRQKQIVTSQKDRDQVRDNKTVINLVEIITPEVVCTLHQLDDSQDITDTEAVTFKSLNELAKTIAAEPHSNSIASLAKTILEDCLIYRCTFCTVMFSGKNALKNLTTHFAEAHKVGHHLICHVCAAQLEMQQLVNCRWKHKCI